MMHQTFMPAEWEPHEATWLAWPKSLINWPDNLEEVQERYLQIIRALCPHEKVYLLVDDQETAETVLEKTRSFPRPENFHPLIIPTTEIWIRDYGTIFARTENDIIGQNFIFNSWGEKYDGWNADNAVPVRSAELLGFPLIDRDIVLEGGSIDVNGCGTLMTTESCLLNPNRNPSLSKSQIEQKLKAYFGVRNVLWLKSGIEGDDTDGHIDDISRFVDSRTIATVVEPDPADANYEPLQENLRLLKSMRDQDGEPFRVLELPMPEPVSNTAGRHPASYANFYIANNVVLMPTYRCPADEAARTILQTCFPNRKIIGIDCVPIVRDLGALHCLTQQHPA